MYGAVPAIWTGRVSGRQQLFGELRCCRAARLARLPVSGGRTRPPQIFIGRRAVHRYLCGVVAASSRCRGAHELLERTSRLPRLNSVHSTRRGTDVATAAVTTSWTPAVALWRRLHASRLTLVLRLLLKTRPDVPASAVSAGLHLPAPACG